MAPAEQPEFIFLQTRHDKTKASDVKLFGWGCILGGRIWCGLILVSCEGGQSQEVTVKTILVVPSKVRFPPTTTQRSF